TSRTSPWPPPSWRPTRDRPSAWGICSAPRGASSRRWAGRGRRPVEPLAAWRSFREVRAMEHAWHVEPAPAREGTGLMFLESARPAASLSRGGAGVVSTLHALQRSAGNRAVRQALRAAVTDAREADAPDEAIVLQPRCACGSTCTRCRQEEGLGGRRLPAAVPRKGSGRPLPTALRAVMEEQFGEDFKGVRVHTDGPARQTAQRLEADAYTVGKDISFRAGQYDPSSFRGRRLLAHELTHVVQQRRGSRPQAALTLGQPGDRYEREAERVAAQVVRPGALASTALQRERGKDRVWEHVPVRERWRGPHALLSRAAPAPLSEKRASPAQAAGLTLAQVACIKRVYERALAMPRTDRWKHCYVTARTATCSLPELRNMAAVTAALNEAIGPADW